jgi:hypothetical protein
MIKIEKTSAEKTSAKKHAQRRHRREDKRKEARAEKTSAEKTSAQRRQAQRSTRREDKRREDKRREDKMHYKLSYREASAWEGKYILSGGRAINQIFSSPFPQTTRGRVRLSSSGSNPYSFAFSVARLYSLSKSLSPRVHSGPPRLAVDRLFRPLEAADAERIMDRDRAVISRVLFSGLASLGVVISEKGEEGADKGAEEGAEKGAEKGEGRAEEGEEGAEEGEGRAEEGEEGAEEGEGRAEEEVEVGEKKESIAFSTVFCRDATGTSISIEQPFSLVNLMDIL